MDEDLGVKAPVTRLRRRMSVEAEESPLPTTPSTPTKKRTTRLAAKPQLELIDEVATENVPKRTTRKAAVKDNVEADTNTGTPTPVTPSRRSTRIRSNTSILSETTTQNVESPRAKRALRRTSQLGSDTESAAVTPARQTRRTRKDSTASLDKQAGAGDENVVVYIVSSTNVENPAKDTSKDSEANKTDNHSPSTRKSPRLQNKKGDKIDVETDATKKESNKSLTESHNRSTSQASPSKKNNIENNENNDTASSTPTTEKENLSTSSSDLIHEIKGKTNSMNNNTSAIEKIANDLKNKRTRTKSWTTLASSPSKVDLTSDNEQAKEKLKGNRTPNTSISGSGDGFPTSNENKTLTEPSPNKSLNANKSSLQNTVQTTALESLDPVAEIESHKSDTVKFFEKAPVDQHPLVLIEDSDSCSVGKLSIDTERDNIEGEDQCVPVVVNPSTNESLNKCEQSVEPMDIDESMPANVTIDDFSDKSNTSKEDIEVPNKRKLSISKDEVDKSGRKSSISIQTVGEEYIKNDSLNKSKNSSILSKERSFSFSQVDNKKDANDSRKSISISEENVEKKNESSNKSKRKSSISQNNSAINLNFSESRKSVEIPPIAQEDKEKLDGSNKKPGENQDQNRSNRKSSVSLNNSAANLNDNTINKSLEKSQRKSSILIGVDNAEQQNESSNKSRRKSSISQTDSEINQKSPKKSKRSSSVSQTDSQIEQPGNENKSTLIISQLKDVSTNDTNNVVSPNVTNNELSKSLSGHDIKNKGVDKKNLSLNYLTSTPIQQKSLQKLTMQINTSIISPAVENKNNTSEKTPKKDTKRSFDSDSSDETDEEIKFKNKDSLAPLKKYARAPSSSESSDNESDTESKNPIKKAVKKVPALETSDSDEESDSKGHQKNKKTPNKKLHNQSKSEAEAKKVKTHKTSPNKKIPALESSDSDEESKSKSQENTKKTPNNQSKSDAKAKKVKTHDKEQSISDNSDTSNDSDSDKKPSKHISKIVDDEASEASDDYESGDSQSEEDKRYAAENEIVEKGETLDSEEEFSNDSEYEKDSFLVSSDAEDNEILSGTGDDLSLSDNELSMSVKSKNKFNERKLKQQKQASREMYEARHKKDESTNSTKSETAKSKKSKRQRLKSSTLESEDENTQPKKSNRLRIDSSQDSLIQSDADESIGIKKKKSKRLSESVHDITTNEKEITVFNQSTIDKNDPLSVPIKQEPKTPQKHFDMSTVAINDAVEEVQVDSDASIMKQNNTLDPLQATMMADDIDDSSSSDNMEIIHNYDSILSELNMQTKKIKTVDTSLNIHKKYKDPKNPVIDQLNLTQTKKSKKNKTVEDQPTKLLKPAKVVIENENSSDSIDLKLLFSEDSNDSEVNASQFKPKINEEPAESFIPLKRTEGQTNIPDNMNMNTSFNVSKKNKRRKSSHGDPEDVQNNTEIQEDNDINIVIDTTGTCQELDTSMAQTNSSKKKKNKKRDKTKEPEDNDIMIVMDTTGTHQELDTSIAQTNSSKKKKNKKHDSTKEPEDNDIKIVIDTTGTHQELDTSMAQTNSSKKKKNKKNKSLYEESNVLESAIDIDYTDGVAETPVEISFASEKKKKKNKNKSLDVSVHNAESSFIVTGHHSAKKSRNKSESTSELNTHNENTEKTIEMPVDISIKSDKKKKKNKNDVSQNIEPAIVVMNSDKETNYSISVKDVPETQITESEEIPAAEISIKSEKKKKKKKNKQNLEDVQNVVDNAGDDSDGAPMEMSYKSEKKSDAPDAVTDDTLTSSEKKKHKKNKKNKNLSQSLEKSGDNVKTIVQDGDASTQRKRKASDPLAVTENVSISTQSLSSSHEKKKRKIQLDDECIAAYNDVEHKNNDERSLKKKNKKKNHNFEQDIVPQTKANKRKNRDDDNEEKLHKVSKQDSFDKIHVPKLPESVINQLTEKPQSKVAQNKANKKKKAAAKATATAIATMPFVVEEAEKRKNKPSNYLEQSVYLNDSPVKTKQKRPKDKPKVLPFTPTALTSDSGYTSKFNINVLPGQTQFVAHASNIENFRESFLGTQRIKKLGTFERCKIHRSQKLSKF